MEGRGNKDRSIEVLQEAAYIYQKQQNGNQIFHILKWRLSVASKEVHFSLTKSSIFVFMRWIGMVVQWILVGVEAELGLCGERESSD